MSVQAGVWHFDGEPTDQNLLSRISQTVVQYGADSEETYIGGAIGMLYRPFHTTKESHLEVQPYVSPKGVVMTWDGRLDNRDDLTIRMRNELTSDTTDVAVVSAMFDRWDTACFQWIIGDWALSVWNQAEKRLVLARDYLGIRHLYYFLAKNSVVWCTHLEPLVFYARESLTLNDEYIAGFLANFPEAHLTPYREIHAVPPGAFVLIRDGQVAVHRYWSFHPQRRICYKSDAEYEDHFRYHFRQAVRRRLRSDSAILAELSGGLDSSSVVCMADDILAKGETEVVRLDTLSHFDPREPGGDERPYIARVEEKRGRQGHLLDRSKYGGAFSLDYRNFISVPGTLARGDSCETDLQSLMLREGYRVVLSGVGGDEFLGGVPDPCPQLADLILQVRLAELSKQLLEWSQVKRRPWIQLLFQTLLLLSPTWARAKLTRRAKVAPWIDRQFARKHLLGVRQLGPLGSFGFWLPSHRDYAQTLIAMSRQMSYLPTSPIGCEERRFPFLDQTLLEFLIAIPADQLLRPGQRRSLMRRALSDIVPPEVLARSTKAFIARANLVAIAAQKQQLGILFMSPASAHFGYIDERALRKDLHAAMNGNASQLVRMMKAVALELWLRDLASRDIIRVPERTNLSVGTNCQQFEA